MDRDEQDRIQRALNEEKKRELQEKYGGTFHSSDPDIPPQVEAEWLRSIEEFERQFAGAAQTTVRRYLGNPSLPPLANIPPQQLPRALEALQALLASHNVLVHFGPDVSEKEAYRFITEELLDCEMDDIRLEGMTQNFLYEEFHPDGRHEASAAAEMFLRDLFSGDRTALREDLAPDGTAGPEGTPINREALALKAENACRGLATCLDLSVNATDCTLEGSSASVTVHVGWEGLQAFSLEKTSGSGRATVMLHREASGWLVRGFYWSPERHAL